ncbi:MAG: sterol desaturase family protein [Candidatus Thioglobus sp.]|uniref:sterol desaturase family protein n=1 Tax=Candidatus Thioglobus sp. TaxID=2026721 RepID=UPI002629456A|nr:sterol desaturase family protein [Candidatus Thioglobus sp.]MDC9726771.1 sterol desaturase family protein [Candidatus Thioglobus sp.]
MEINPLEYLLNPNKRIFWIFLLSSLLIALTYLWLNPREKRINFSKKLWLHPSAILDYGYFVFMAFFKVLVIFPILFGAKEVALWVNAALLGEYGYTRLEGFSYAQIMFIFTLSLFIVSDFTRYWLHRFLHTMPMLWEFHKVHHSAKVLNPLTFYRVHPVESLLFGLRYSLSIGLVSGVFIFFFGAMIDIYDILGVNILAFMFSLIGSNLRHSHIRLGFGEKFEKFLISPYQHQIHHSKHHTDTNFGGFLAIWDWIFGTLTLSKGVGRLKLGINSDDMKNFGNFQNLVFFPFFAIYQSFKKHFF